MPVITIRGKMGSGAPEIGRMLAEQLKYDYIDREIIAAVATRLNLQENEVIAKEMPPVTLRERIEEALQKGYAAGIGVQGAYLPISQIPLDDTRYINALTSLIKDLASSDNMVMRSPVEIGRMGAVVPFSRPTIGLYTLLFELD